MSTKNLNGSKDINFINEDTILLDTRVKHEYDNIDFNSMDSDTIPLDTREGSEYDRKNASHKLLPKLDTREGSEYDTERVRKHEYDTERVLSHENDNLECLRHNFVAKLDTRVKHEYDNLESFSCHSRAQTRESRNMDIMPLDSRIKYENDNIESSSCHSGLRAGIQRGDNLMPKAFRFAQSGRSMVEMLGVLAVMGVLSIGGIIGYNYAVNKHHANQVLQDIRLIYQELKYPNTVHQIVFKGAFPDTELDLQSPYEYGFDFANPDDFNYDSTSEKTPNLISVNVSGVPQTTCDILLKTKPEYALMLKVNGETTWNCTQDENELNYIFEITADSLEYGKCTVCTGAHCFDDDLNCPEGEYCYNDTCSKCARSYTENTSGVCKSCDFTKHTDLTQENCHRCGDTIFGSDPSMGGDTNCYSCDNVYLRTTQEYCQRCIDKDENVMFLGIDCINCKTRFIHTQNTTKENCFKCAEIKGQNGTQYSENVIWNEKMGAYGGLCVSCYSYGAVANGDKTECVCPNGKFWGLSDGWWNDIPRCFSCDDTETYASTINACNRCPNRYYTKHSDANIQCALCLDGKTKSADGKSCVDKPAE